MAYSKLITYSVYDLNGSLFVEMLRDILTVEFNNQIDNFGNTFLPTTIKTDEYLLSPIADKEINPAFVSIIKAKMDGSEQRFNEQNDNLNYFIIGILANGLINLRQISDAIYEILNDLDVKTYIFNYTNSDGDTLVTDSGKYMVKSLNTEYEVSKTMNDKEIVYGSLVIQAEIGEVVKINSSTDIDSINLSLKMGSEEKEINNLTEY